MSDLKFDGVPVTSNSAVPEYKSVLPSVFFGFFAAPFQANNAKKRGLKGNRYWAAAGISTFAGVALSILLLVAAGLIVSKAASTATAPTSSDATNDQSTGNSSQSIPVQPQPVENAKANANDPVNTTGKCAATIDPALEASPTLTVGQLGQILPQMFAVRATGVGSRNATCFKIIYANQSFIASDMSLAATGHTYKGKLIQLDANPDGGNFGTDVASPYKGQPVSVACYITTTDVVTPHSQIAFKVSLVKVGNRWVFDTFASL